MDEFLPDLFVVRSSVPKSWTRANPGPVVCEQVGHTSIKA